jgi:hypothetical protein
LGSPVKTGLLHAPISKEEKLLIQSFRKAPVAPIMIDDRKLIMAFHTLSEVGILGDLFAIVPYCKTCLCCSSANA